MLLESTFHGGHERVYGSTIKECLFNQNDSLKKMIAQNSLLRFRFIVPTEEEEGGGLLTVKKDVI